MKPDVTSIADIIEANRRDRVGTPFDDDLDWVDPDPYPNGLTEAEEIELDGLEWQAELLRERYTQP